MSASQLYHDYPTHLTEEEQAFLLTEVKDWSIANGLAVRPSPAFITVEQDPQGVLATTAPVTLFPSLFPRSCFNEALEVQTLYNSLYASIARDEEWLAPIIEEIQEIDDFVGELWKIWRIMKKEGLSQPLSLGLFRSDYMVHTDTTGPESRLTIRQVEFNTIASSFGGLSSKVSELHDHLAAVNAYPSSVAAITNNSNLSVSTAARDLATGLAVADKHYQSQAQIDRRCVLFVVQDPERNVFDQRHLEYQLFSKHKVRSFRLPFRRILQDTKLGDDKVLYYQPPHSPKDEWEVSVIYFRAGYGPSDYQSADDWAARLHLERSRAIKCPSILTHLAGCKKIQQVLATPNSPHLSRFLPEKDASKVAATFAPIYPLDDSEAGLEARRLAKDPEEARRFVLKPQREGGGNNVYRKAIPAFLKDVPENKWPAYILMEMIEPPVQRNVIFRNGEVERGGVICELGVYGVALWHHTDGLITNQPAGYLLRTKGDQSEEGGVAAGFGAVDSVCLIDD